MTRCPRSVHPAVAAGVALLLAAAGPAHAQSSVTLGGVLDAFAGQRQLAGRTAVRTLDSGGMTTSRWGVDGVEDLGGGLRAQVGLSAFLRVDSGDAGRTGTDPYWARSAFVGLSGPFGQVRLGRIGTPTFGVAIRFSPFADSTTFSPYALHLYTGGQPLAAPMNAPDSAASNTLAYTTPTISGFSASALYAPGEVAGDGSRRRGSLGLNWSAGPVALAVAHERVTVPGQMPAGVSRIANTQAGASWDLGAVKLFGQLARTGSAVAAGTRTQSTVQAGASVPVGAGAVLASVAQSRREEPAAPDLTRRTIGLGYDHLLSRRTDVYAVLLQDQLTGVATGRTLVAGVRHRF